ncbi:MULTISPECIES: class I SAM-dependent methyltransferase [Chromobacterium]|nr:MULTISPECIES: class I SAM-dependent methyltransferase [Chromobacterium]QOZ82923.1 class I SAM-dependent methyltransferase [Chromobacterium sp. Rain0013]WON83000.1 class I SAM-dependent methyltransferase [Chromobacterium haemolyticum]
MKNSEQDLIHWKTEAWKDRDMVRWYSGRMDENTDTNRLKNIIETELCERFLAGSDVLDVGIGTGRASLPLIAKGFNLSGTDSSQAMLDECRRLAGGAPIELVQGDVQALPFPDQCFDSLISLNVMTHFPHVEKVLHEWKRVVRPGGRLIFDIYSLDHLSFARQADVTVDELMAQGASAFNMHLSAERLCLAANEIGLKVLGTVPYGSLFSGEYHHPAFPMPLQQTNWWRRQLSWLAADSHLLEMSVFLEREWFGCLSGITTGRFMVVLENSVDVAANQQWLEQDGQLNNYLVGEQVRLDDLAPWLGMAPDEWRTAFDLHLDRARNRTVAYFLLSSFLGRTNAVDWTDLAPRNGAILQRWSDAETIDRDLQGFVRSWHQDVKTQHLCQVNEVDLASALEYRLQRRLVTELVSAGNGAQE